MTLTGERENSVYVRKETVGVGVNLCFYSSEIFRTFRARRCLVGMAPCDAGIISKEAEISTDI